VVYIEVLPRYLPGEAEESHVKAQCRIAVALPDIQTDELPNTDEPIGSVTSSCFGCICPKPVRPVAFACQPQAAFRSSGELALLERPRSMTLNERLAIC
jgi:hypothetical protein